MWIDLQSILFVSTSSDSVWLPTICDDENIDKSRYTDPVNQMYELSSKACLWEYLAVARVYGIEIKDVHWNENPSWDADVYRLNNSSMTI